MISVIYRNPKRPAYSGYVPFQQQQHQHGRGGAPAWTHETKPTIPASSPLTLPPPVAPARSLPTHTTLAEAATRAAKIGITTIEWQRRDAIVRRLFAENDRWKFMDPFFPSLKADYESMGMCWFIGATSSYKEIDHTPWPEDDEIMIFSGRAAKTNDEFVCNLKYMSKERPLE